jgi:hypothetical protein
MLVEIALVHLGGRVGAWCNEGLGRVSVAAGFVFLSGLVAGAVYSRTTEQGRAATVQRCARRCLYIYGYHVAAFLALLAVVLFKPQVGAFFHFPLSPPSAALRMLGAFAVWLYQPLLFDILPMYGLFVLCMPAALLALRAGHGPSVWLVSLALWGLAQLGLGHLADDSNRFGFFSGGFNPLAWQFVFFSGLYFGYMHLYRRRRVVFPRARLIALSLLVCVIGFTMRWQLLSWPAEFQDGGWLASKRDYGAAYLINFLAFAYLVYCLAGWAPRLFTWRALAFLGQHSIQVFSFHIVAVYLALAELRRLAPIGELAYDALGVTVVASLFLPAWWHARWTQRAVAPARVFPSTSTM